MNDDLIRVRVREGCRYGAARANEKQYQAGEEFEISAADFATLRHVLIAAAEDDERKAQIAKATFDEEAQRREVFDRARQAHIDAANLQRIGREKAVELAASAKEDAVKRVERDLKIELPKPKSSKKPDLSK